MVNYLITGGTGLIGKGIIDRLSQKETEITVLTRNISRAKKILGPDINIIDKLSLEHIENKDVVINLAGEPIANKRWTKTQKDNICQSRWQVTQQLVELIKQADAPPSLFISGSAIGIYGRQEGKCIDECIDECYQQFTPEFTHHICSTWEGIALGASSDKTRVAILRTGVVLAKNGGALSKMMLPFKLGVGGKISHGKQVMSWIHLEDMISAVLHIQENEALKGAINLTAPYPVSNKEFSQALASQLNRSCLLTTPAWILTLVFGEMADILLFGQKVIPKKLINSGYSFQFSTIEAALSDIVK